MHKIFQRLETTNVHKKHRLEKDSNKNNILKKAAPLANSDADKYAAEKAKADGRFKEALDYLEEAAKISPENENVKKILDY